MKQLLSTVEMRIYQGNVVLGNVEFWGHKFKVILVSKNMAFPLSIFTCPGIAVEKLNCWI